MPIIVLLGCAMRNYELVGYRSKQLLRVTPAEVSIPIPGNDTWTDPKLVLLVMST